MTRLRGRVLLLCAIVLCLCSYLVSVSPALADHEPGVRITSGPAGIRASTSVAFTFSSASIPRTFQCRLTGSSSYTAWSACSAAVSYVGLRPGLHTFQVRRLSDTGVVLDSASQDIEITFPDGASTEPAMSGDGRFTAYVSSATTLTIDDRSEIRDVFITARESRSTDLVSVSSSGDAANGASGAPSVSDDGRYIAFESTATNLVPQDTNGGRDVFIRDRVSKTTVRVTDWSGQEWAGRWCSDYDESGGGSAWACGEPAGSPAISGDGRFVAFVGAYDQVMVFDRVLGVTVSRESDSTLAWGTGDAPSISDDGRYVAFHSATRLVQADTNPGYDVYVRDRWAGLTGLASLSDTDGAANGNNYFPSISDNGRWVAFESSATNLQTICCLPRDNSTIPDVYLRDRSARTTRWISHPPYFQQTSLSHASFDASVLGDQGVVFATGARFSGDLSADSDILEWDIAFGGGQTLLSTDVERGAGNGASRAPSGSDDGGLVAYETLATNLIAGDTNGTRDVALHTWATATASARSAVARVRRNGTTEGLRAASSRCRGRHRSGRRRTRTRVHWHGNKRHVHRYVVSQTRGRTGTGRIRARAADFCQVIPAGAPLGEGSSEHPADDEIEIESEDEAKTDSEELPRLSPEETKKARREYEKARPDLWRKEAEDNPDDYTAEQLENMRDGKAPIGSDGWPMHWHHIPPLSRGGPPADRNHLEPMTREDHIRGGNYRRNHPP